MPPPENRERVEMVQKEEKYCHAKANHKRKPPPLESWMLQSIAFEPLEDEDIQDGPLVIFANVAGHRIRRIHVDGCSGAEIMFEHCFKCLDENLQARLVPDHLPLIGFSREKVLPVGKVAVPVTLGEGDKFHIVNLTFSVVQANSKNNIIMGRPGIKVFRGVVSTGHRIMKFPNPKEQTVKVGAQLSNKVKADLKELLIRNMVVFAWEEADMAGIPRDLVEHKLNTYLQQPDPTEKAKHGFRASQSRMYINQEATASKDSEGSQIPILDSKSSDGTRRGRLLEDVYGL
ncbi:hypothetical protein L1987_22720 [Smallanthus sonchifolius]|uniref:Uncharacterized protein n=1 Tax=Smallanthus sonchifolius TaxID=185202 RepID=A0ACB9IFM2_9ASTR|nr:hypothetical protein L1987_22720 [Smallanthus sonchifolius]